MKLTVRCRDRMIHISSDDINYNMIECMYKDGDGYGLQVNDESKREATKKMCDAIAVAVLEFGRKEHD